MNDLLQNGMIFGIFCIIFYTPYLAAKGVLSLDGEFPIKERIKSLIPIFNIVYTEKFYYGRIGLCTISTLSVIISFVLRIFLWYNFYENVTIGTVSIIVLYASIAFFIFANMKFVYDVIADSAVLQDWKFWFFVIAFPMGQWYIGTCINNAIKYNKKIEETFRG